MPTPEELYRDELVGELVADFVVLRDAWAIAGLFGEGAAAATSTWPTGRDLAQYGGHAEVVNSPRATPPAGLLEAATREDPE